MLKDVLVAALCYSSLHEEGFTRQLHRCETEIVNSCSRWLQFI